MVEPMEYVKENAILWNATQRMLLRSSDNGAATWFPYPFENLFGELPGLSVSIVATKDANLKPSAGRVTRVTMQQVMSTTERALSVDAGIDADVPLIETGLDSLASSELTDNLQKLVGAELPGTLLFDAPTVRQTFAFL
mmetsp:Transcript_41402/g.121054  ORF Transcript_41402/g.121054 Transcript_41402/m.121054 type:complete len:139 (+) Transcript_41402:1237-1653(+)